MSYMLGRGLHFIMKRIGSHTVGKALEARMTEQDRKLLRQVDILTGCVIMVMAILTAIGATLTATGHAFNGVQMLIGGAISIFMAIWARRLFRWMLRLETAGRLGGDAVDVIHELWRSRRELRA